MKDVIRNGFYTKSFTLVSLLAATSVLALELEQSVDLSVTIGGYSFPVVENLPSEHQMPDYQFAVYQWR